VLLFLCFWPTLFAGPIWRAADFFAQRDAGACGRPLQPHRALYLIGLGLLQKLVLASWLATQVVDPVYRWPEQYGSLSVLGAMVGYSLQIFFDFAGYTWIVTGLALLLGYRLPDNFLQPYLARNVQAFWTRWHVSLSRFIRDFIYIPLGGSRLGWTRTQWNVLAAMLLSGLWHGAQWTFVLWGLLHGLAVVALHLGQRAGLRAWPRGLAQATTFAFVTLAWVFFRADDVPQALEVLQALWPADEAGVRTALPGLAVVPCLLAALWWFSARATTLEAQVVQTMQEMGRLQLLCLLVLTTSVLVGLGPDGVPGFIYYRF
jgi:D-alanyl-lipoteichoic acid acyltransferase DltB (MBOAT superfamily)